MKQAICLCAAIAIVACVISNMQHDIERLQNDNKQMVEWMSKVSLMATRADVISDALSSGLAGKPITKQMVFKDGIFQTEDIK